MGSQSKTQASRKRKLDEINPQTVTAQDSVRPSSREDGKENLSQSVEETSLLTPPVDEDKGMSGPAKQGTTSKDVKMQDGEGEGETETETGDEGSPSPSASAASTPAPTPAPAPATILPGMTISARVPVVIVTGNPPAKRARVNLTPTEKVQKEQRVAAEKVQKAAEKAQKETEKAQKEAEKAQKEVEKAQKEAEKEAQKAAKKTQRDAEKAQKDAEKAQKDSDKAQKDAEKAQRDADKVAKAAEKARKDDEKKKVDEKKKRSQLKLGNFFVAAAPDAPKTTKVSTSKLQNSAIPAPNTTLDAESATADDSEVYDTLFSGFFLREDTELAPWTRFERDSEASAIVTKALDSYLAGDRSPGREREYDPVSLYHLGSIPKRGREHLSVRAIMNQTIGTSSQVIDLTTDSQKTQMLRVKEMLKHIPMKLIQFQEDVRPPYRGTFTSRPRHGMEKLARNPFRRDRTDTNYDDDSEAEWVEGEEDEVDAEDLRSEVDDDDEDDDEDMEDFLDDENDETAHPKRLGYLGDLEPVSTGLCWENKHNQNSNVKLISYQMVVMTDANVKSIDPFSTSYWDSSPDPKAMPPPRIPLNVMNPPNTKTNNGPSLQSLLTGGTEPTKKLIPNADMPAFRIAVQGSRLSKVGLVETLKLQFPGRSASVIKDTVTHIATNVGKGRSENHWVLNNTDGV